VTVSTVIFALILRAIDADLVWDTLKAVNPGGLAIALLLQLCSSTVAAYRWHLIMRNLRFGQSPRFYWRSYLKGMFFNQGLPTSIGGDAMRVLDVARQGFRKRDALYGVMLDRIVGLTALLMLNLIAHTLSPQLLPSRVYSLTMILVLSGVVLFGLAFALRDLAWLDAYPRLEVAKTLSARLHQAFSAHRAVLVILSLGIHLLAMMCFYVTGSALGLQYNLMTYLVVVPPAIFLTLIPISLAGWGMREGALVALFSLIGADKAAVLTMSILYGFILIAVSVLGLVVYLADRQRAV
jgi:uncharacterized membrane protein YbhN (UPF0104 family)